MSRLVPYPLLSLLLLLMWLLLTQFSVGNLVLGSILATIAGRAVMALQPAAPRLRNWRTILRLLGIVFVDIVRSNIAVAWIILTNDRHGGRKSDFVLIPLRMRDPNALMLLACILTATPGTAWLEYGSDSGVLTLHVFDLLDEAEWQSIVRDHYETMLMEIFE